MHQKPISHVTVSIATYKRPQLLRELLESLEALILPQDISFDCIVVDNDAGSSSKGVVQEFKERLSITYAVEPQPGIVAARNRGLELLSDSDAIVFVDDDEFVSEHWLHELLKVANETSADVVTGPVVSLLPKEFSVSEKRMLPFIQRAELKDRSSLRVAATNNTLLRMSSWVNLGRPKFDESFSFTGGSDSAFFTRGNLAGWTFVHSARSVVFEVVPHERLTFKWVKRRARRVGNVLYRMRLERMRKFPGLGAAAKYIGFAILYSPVETIRFGRIPYRSISKLYVGLGVIEAMRGENVQEYKRA